MERIETATLIWHGIEIETSCKYAYPLAHYCHIELRCGDRLPITATGYRSHFIPMAELKGFETHVAYVTAWLERAAQSPDWQHHVENRRQGDLFDP